MPHFIITYGPTGSGKGYLLDRFIDRLHNEHAELGVVTKENSYFAEVDSYIENNEVYKLAVFDVMKHFYRKVPRDVQLDDFLLHKLSEYVEGSDKLIGRELSDKMFEAYSSVKGDVKKKFMSDLRDAIASNKHIIYELTGSKGTDPLEKFFGPKGLLNGRDDYVVSIVFPYVDDSVIIKRATQRFIERVTKAKHFVKKVVEEIPYGSSLIGLQNLNNFMKIVPPRLPDILELKTLKIGVSQLNLVQYVNSKHVKNILVYDNNVSSEPLSEFNLSKKKQDSYHKRKFAEVYGDNIHPELKEAILQSSARIFFYR